jgi:hypothetical protein
MSARRAPVARSCEALPSDRVAGRALRWDKTEERHQLSWRIEPAYVADLRGKGHGDEKRTSAHRLIGFHHWRHGPPRHDESELLLEAAHSLERILNRVDAFLKNDLLRCMLELLIASQRPCASVQWPPPL